MMSLKTYLLPIILAFLTQNATSFELMNKPATVSTLKEPQALANPPHSPSINQPPPRCSEAFNANNTGGIFYKPFERIENNERCAWTIGVPGAVGYEINIYLMVPPTNQPGSTQKLVITGIRHGGITGVDPPVFKSYMPTSYGHFRVTDANILVITFYSETLNAAPGTGFILQYEAIYSGNVTQAAVESIQSIAASTAVLQSHPPVGYYYFDMELSSFLIVQNDNFYNGKWTNVLYQLVQMQGGCLDSLFVYTFNTQSSKDVGVWQLNRRICSNVTFDYIPSKDMVLLLFQSDQRNRYSGFRFSSFSC